jgi:predicted flap endonuclease-1-like 5' DNA nuclease
MKLSIIEGIGDAYQAKLIAAGVRSTGALLSRCASSKGREQLAEATGISAKLILEWVNHVDLMRIAGVGPEYADLLEEAGVDTVVELAQRNPENLFAKLTEVNQAKKLVRKRPTLKQVQAWVQQAATLPRMIEY